MRRDAGKSVPPARFVLPLLVFFEVLLLLNVEARAAGDPTAGAQKAVLCIGCHMPGQANPDPLVPTLAGQHANYIVEELLDYQTGRRQDPVMSAIVRTITSSDDMLDIAAYYQALPRVPAAVEAGALAARGKALFRNERCTFCHGDSGNPDTPFLEGAPVIGGQNKAYLAKTLTDIRDGIRVADKFGLMQRVLSRQTDDDIDAMAEYISSLRIADGQ